MRVIAVVAALAVLGSPVRAAAQGVHVRVRRNSRAIRWIGRDSAGTNGGKADG